MTLSIAGTCLGIFKNLPVYPDGVFFITDSRITFKNNQKADIAPKLFRLSKYAGLVYAGSVSGAIYIKKYLKQYFRENKVYSIDEIFYIYKKKYKKLKLKGRNKRADMLIGYYDIIKNKTKLYKLKINQEDECDFDELNGIHAIGSSIEIRTKLINDIEEYLKTLPGFNLHPINWITYVSIVLKNRIIKEGIDPGIGGLVQTAFLDKSGFKWITQADMNKLDESWSVTKRTCEGWQKTIGGRVVSKTEPFLERDKLGKKLGKTKDK